MIYLCLASKMSVETFVVSTPQGSSLPLTNLDGETIKWQGEELILPVGYIATRTDDVVSLEDEGNYPIFSQGIERGVLMIRHVKEKLMEATRFLLKNGLKIGRSSSNDLCCRDSFLSSKHGEIIRTQAGVLKYIDYSTNGTWINDENICGEERILKNGDVLFFPPALRLVVDGISVYVNHPDSLLHCRLSPCVFDAEKYQLVLFRSIATGVLTHALYAYKEYQFTDFELEGRKLQPTLIMTPNDQHILSTGEQIHAYLGAGNNFLLVT